MTERQVELWREHRWKTVLSLLGMTAFFVLFAWMLAIGAPATRRFPHWYALFIAWFGVVTTSVIAVLGVRKLVNPTRLVVGPDGFEHFGAWRHPLVRWEDVAEFVVVGSRGRWTLGYRLTEAGKARRAPVRFNVAKLYGCDGWVLNSWLGPHRLLDQLEAYRQSAVNSGASLQAIT